MFEKAPAKNACYFIIHGVYGEIVQRLYLGGGRECRHLSAKMGDVTAVT